MELLLIRHALPVRLESDRPVDPPLAALGRAQGEALAAWLEPEPPDALVSSTMLRAVQTAEHLAEKFSLVPTEIEALCELDRGTHAYIPLEELDRDHPHMQALMADWVGPEAAPRRAAFQAGIMAALDALVAAEVGERVAVVCHGGVINAALSHVLQMERVLFFQPDYTSISRLTVDNGRYRLKSVNEAGHLRLVKSPD